MYIGVGIFLLVVGAILSFAVRDSISAVDLTMVGYICMGAGALAIVLSFLVQAGGRRTGEYNARRVTTTDPNTGTTVDETHVDRGQGPGQY
ncbi:MAG: DUF6458 family protein [Tetrasphaera sp.]